MLRHRMIGAAVISFLLLVVPNAEIVYGQKASGDQLFSLQSQTNKDQTDKDQAIETAGTEKKYARSTVDRLNVRTEPDLTSSVILMIGKSNRYKVLEEQGEWVKIREGRKSRLGI